MIDEAQAGDNVVVLHQGKVLAAGGLDAVVAQSGKANLREAFAQLTGIGRANVGAEAA